ncbi:DUF835 domain-containing protein [Thermococcus sp.]
MLEGPGLLYLTGVMLVFIGIYGMMKSYREYQRHAKPIKRLAATLTISFFLFGIIGGLAVFLMVFYGPSFWVLEAVSVTASYLLLSNSALGLLEKVEIRHRIRRKPVSLCPLPVAGVIGSRRDALTLLRALKSYMGTPTMIIAREHPERWRRITGLRPEEYVWLTRVEHPQAISPSNLHVLTERVIEFLRTSEDGVVYIEGIEYMLFYSDFRAVAKFLFSIRDTAMIYGGHVLVLANDETLRPEYMAILKREFEEVRVNELLEKIVGPTLFGVVAKRRKGYASSESSEKRSGVSEKEAQKDGPLRWEEEAEERG